MGTASIVFQLLGAIVTFVGLLRAFWNIRDVLDTLRNRSVDATVLAATARGGGTAHLAAAAVIAIRPDAPIGEQVAQIRDRLQAVEADAQLLAQEAERAKVALSIATAQISETEDRVNSQTDHKINRALDLFSTNSKINLAQDIGIAAFGVVLSGVGTALAFWA